MRRGRRASAVGATLLAASLMSCTIEPPLAHINPFDPGAKANFWISGPDSVHGAGTRFTMRLEGTKPLPSGSLLIGWHSSHPAMVAGGAGGEFLVMSASPTYVAVIIRAELGEDVVYAKTVYVGQP